MSGLRILAIIVIAGLSASLSPSSISTKEACTGFVPQNDLYIPSTVKSRGVDRQTYDEVLDRAEEVYDSIISEHGGNLKIRRLWDNGTVNASAQRRGSTFIVNMYGGLARHRTMTADGFMLVVCHELGHHVGGAPKIDSFFNRWASNEGQSDYYASLKCLRRMFPDHENQKWVQENSVDPEVKARCVRVHSKLETQNVCMRMSMAGYAVGRLFQELREEEHPPRFETPDTNIVDYMKDSHPATQCRLDTYFHGALCIRAVDEPVQIGDPEPGTCVRSQGHLDGPRPLCWYYPS